MDFSQKKWGFPKTRGTLLGGPIIRTIVFWGLFWGPIILGNYQMWLRVRAWEGGELKWSVLKTA